jgi:hypothetical protein
LAREEGGVGGEREEFLKKEVLIIERIIELIKVCKQCR